MLAIGMALMVGPSLLMLDEPLLGLSPAMQTALVRAIKAVSGIHRNRRILISEQFARPILPMIDRGYVIENGMLTLTGTEAGTDGQSGSQSRRISECKGTTL